ncbi:MAG: response regulator transcription factor [Melioribacteraceae bacterium]|nr:response regulator transcription factor [Melioribacteraceae bacterium]
MNKISIVISDDHLMFREGIKTMLEKEKIFSVVGVAGNAKETIEQIEINKPDVLLLDISLGNANGIDVAKQIRTTNTSTKIIMLTMHKNENYIKEAIFSKIDGYVLKSEEISELKTAILSVIKGGLYISAESREDTTINLGERESRIPRNIDSDKVLTKREVEIVKLIAEGNTYQQISEKLFISQYTVINHRQNISHKLGLKSNMAIVQYAQKMGLIG